MADQLGKSSEKYHHDISPNSEQSLQKLEDDGESMTPVEAKTITNIYYDCLERIFDFLDLKDLFMVANTCKRLQIAAAAKFGDEYGNKCVFLNLLCIYRPQVQVCGPNKIEVIDSKFCLPFVRCFGRKITKLTAYYRSHRSTDQYLGQYINQYCADTLTDILIYRKSKFSSEECEKPFKNVEKVEILVCRLTGESLANFVNWFPKMRHLEVYGCTIADNATTNVHFPQLERLVLSIEANDSDNERNENAMDIVESNRQLQSLKIVSDFELTLSTLVTKIRANSTITKLRVNIGSTTDVNANELDRFMADHPLMVELALKGYRLAAHDAINFIRQMKLLKRIGFQADSRAECDRIITKFEGEWKSEVSTDDGKFYIKLNR